MISKTAKKICDRYGCDWYFDFHQNLYVIQHRETLNTDYIAPGALKEISPERFKECYASAISGIDIEVTVLDSPIRSKTKTIIRTQYILSYQKNFLTGVLAGDSVDARCTYPDKQSMEKHLTWCKEHNNERNPATDTLTNHKFYVNAVDIIKKETEYEVMM